jgi:hypothetical protein
MGDRWNAMREPVSLEDYAMAADQRLRDLVNRPMDLSEQGKLPEIAGTTEPSQSFSRQPLGPMPRPEITSDYGDSAGYIAAGATFDPVRGWVGSDGNDMVISRAVRSPSDGAAWQVKADFTNPLQFGGLGAPLPVAHTGFKVYRNGKMAYAIDGGPQGPGEGLLGNLKFDGAPEEMTSARAGIRRLGEIPLAPPQGISAQIFGERLKQAAKDYDGSLPYGLPPPHYYQSPAPTGETPPHFSNVMGSGEYNSNSFAAGLLNRAGAAPNIAAIQNHLTSNNWAAPGLEQPVPQRYFRSR